MFVVLDLGEEDNMGYERERFVGEVDEELVCAVCGLILKDPVQIRQCEHCFCHDCIEEWWKHRHICPIDRTVVPSWDDVIAPPRIVKNMLARLVISCDNHSFGCTETIRLECLPSHLNQCQYNPKRLVGCEKGCGQDIPFDELENHNCLKQLHTCLKKESERVSELEDEVKSLKDQLVETRNEMTVLNHLVMTLRSTRAMPTSGSSSIAVFPNPSYPDEVERAIQTSIWLSTLRPARIRRWGGMISTPDSSLQTVIERGLIDLKCPTYLVRELMENSHERRWPSGLNTLETRQMNRRRYEQYVTKRIPGKQAIVIMLCENEHMDPSMVVSPGMVMIFAHGVD